MPFSSHRPAFMKSTAIVLLAGATLLTSACSYAERLTGAVMPSERTVPDTGMTPLGGKRLPVLNPGGRLYRANDDLESQKLAAENPYMNEGIRSDPRNMPPSQVRSEVRVDEPYPMPGNQAVQARQEQSGGWFGNVFNSKPDAESARRMPVENIQLMQSPPTLLSAPVAPVAQGAPVAELPAPPPAIQMAAQSEQPLSPVTVPQKEIYGKDGYPQLSATPAAPAPLPPGDNYNARMNNLVADRDLAENIRREMMQNPDAVHSSPPANSMAAATPQTDPEFNSWVKRMFNEEDNSKPKQIERPVAMNTPPKEPMPLLENAEPGTPVANETRRAITPNFANTPPSAPEPIQMASAPPMEPIHLTPPPAQVLDVPEPMGLTSAGQEPIMLQPPAAVVNRNVRFMPEGRYAARRAGSRSVTSR